LLDAAARVFSRYGYAAGTTNRIAEEAGVSVGSLYQYFPNKDSILVELVRSHVAEGTAAVLAALDAERGPGGSVADRRRAVEVVVGAMIANHAGDPALHQVLFEEAPRPPEILAELHRLEGRAVAAAAAVLDADPTVGVADTALAARLVVTTIESVVHRMVATRERPVDLDAFRRELAAMVNRYLDGESAPA
jgi:AcrR family transcriptional regulator